MIPTPISLISGLLRVCEAPLVLGRPVYVARYVSHSLCRVRWLAAVAIPLWLLTLVLHLRYVARDLEPVLAQSGGPLAPTVTVALVLPIAIGVVGALFILVFPRAPCATPTARRALLIFVAASLACEGLQLGLSQGAMVHMPSFVLANLFFFALVPLGIYSFLGLAAWSFALPVAAALLAGIAPVEIGRFAATLTLPVAAAIFGAVVNLWNFQSYRRQTLAGLRLRRRTVQSERQKQEIDRQRAAAVRQQQEAERLRRIAESQREEAELQRARAMRLLASALTGPIAERYERQGYVEPSTRHVVIVFCDAVGFSGACEKMLPERIVSAIREFWLRFDDACLSMRVEPLRAEGDARIAIAGLGMEGGRVYMHQAAIGALLAMLRFRKSLPPVTPDGETLRIQARAEHVMWPARIGVTIGSVAAGVIDTSDPAGPSWGSGDGGRVGRLWFDVWGDTLNVAARLAQTARPNQILTRERVLWESGGLFEHGPLHGRRVKKVIIPDCVEVFDIRPEYRDANGEPNEAFWAVFRSESYRPMRPDPRGTLVVSA